MRLRRGDAGAEGLWAVLPAVDLLDGPDKDPFSSIFMASRHTSSQPLCQPTNAVIHSMPEKGCFAPQDAPDQSSIQPPSGSSPEGHTARATTPGKGTGLILSHNAGSPGGRGQPGGLAGNLASRR